VRTLCRLPRIWKFSEARNVRRFQFEDYAAATLSGEGQEAIRLLVAAARVLLFKILSPRRVAGLGGLAQCQSCGAIGPGVGQIRHRNCLWLGLSSGWE
jgi:hypothetical protein